MTRLIDYLLLLLLMMTTTTTTYAVALDSQTGLFWQIVGPRPDITPSYLFGTIHSDDPRVSKLPPLIQQRLEQANSVVLELLMDIPTIQQASNAKFFDDSQTLDALLDPALYNKIVAALQPYQLSATLIKKMKPVAVLTLLQTPPPKNGNYLDFLLYQQAMALKILPYGLEQVPEQLQLFDAFSPAEQLILLTDTVNYINELPAIFEQLHQLYLQKNLTTLLTYSQNYLLAHSSHPTLTQTFLKRLLSDRNYKMLTRMLPRLQEGNAFIAVGALHLPGADGLLNLLVQRGYRVIALY